MSGSRQRTPGAVDVAIVGGGIIGCTLAYELARKGISAAVIERGEVGGEASWASAGIISPPSHAAPPLRLELGRRSLAGYPWLIATVQEETGVDVGYRHWGEILIARDEAEVAGLRELLAWQEGNGFDSEWVEATDLHDLEPALPAGLLGAVLVNDAGAVVVNRLTRALARAAVARGAAVLEHTPAVGFAREGDRTTGVRLADGALLPAGQVVLAAGAWTARFGVDLDRPLPTLPVKGQMMALADAPVMPHHVIGGAGGYLVPRTDGSIAVGATEERVGFDKRVTPAGLRELIGLVEALGPGLLEGMVTATWAGLRPGTIDREPILGLVPGYRNLWVATGHFRQGVQLAIGTAELMVDSLQAGRPDPLLDAASAARFAAGT
ncbi:MAG TPA: glycine oxidase ThiO [Thermomicrobiaceae bacterium]|nr:glycine oxidase ThiO [Thermomicrobiaceae bacterium]